MSLRLGEEDCAQPKERQRRTSNPWQQSRQPPWEFPAKQEDQDGEPEEREEGMNGSQQQRAPE